MAHASSLSKGTSDTDSLQRHVHLVAHIQNEMEEVWAKQKLSNDSRGKRQLSSLRIEVERKSPVPLQDPLF